MIPSVYPSRKAKLDKLLETLQPQITNQVELLIFSDNKKRTLWYKRNEMLSLAKGKYTVFLDDDDEITPDYVKTLLDATRFDMDVICYNVEISINWWEKHLVKYSKDLTEHFDGTVYYRKPNHLMCFKREIALKEPYSDLQFWEDSDYAERIYKYIESEYHIDKVLYHYVSIPNNSECQR